MCRSDGTLSAYLARLGLEAEPPGVAALTRLHLAHLERVPFENLDIQMGVPIHLDEPRLLAKLLSGRGGFCYELNGAFAWLLRELGYAVTLLEARVPRADGGLGIPFDHLTLQVDLERPYLVDVGFGDGFVEPLAFDGSVAIQPSGEYRIRNADAGRVLERRHGGSDWAVEYAFTSVARRLADFEPGSRHHQTSPDSSFVRGPICSRLDGDERITLHRDRLTRGERLVPVASRAHWAELLEAHFGIVLDGYEDGYEFHSFEAGPPSIRGAMPESG